jgi:hypothetical protein
LNEVEDTLSRISEIRDFYNKKNKKCESKSKDYIKIEEIVKG